MFCRPYGFASPAAGSLTQGPAILIIRRRGASTQPHRRGFSKSMELLWVIHLYACYRCRRTRTEARSVTIGGSDRGKSRKTGVRAVISKYVLITQCAALRNNYSCVYDTTYMIVVTIMFAACLLVHAILTTISAAMETSTTMSAASRSQRYEQNRW